MDWESGANGLGVATWLARIGSARASATHPSTEPLFQTSVYDFESLEQLDLVQDGEQVGFTYARMGHPNATTLEEAVARLEGAEAGCACSSGMGALSAALLAVLESGTHLIAARGIYGGTSALLVCELARLGIGISFVDISDLKALAEAITPRTRLVLVETLSNPLMQLPDLTAVVQLAHQHGLQVLADNTLATPWLMPLQVSGADMAIHSVTKFLGGHHDLMAGVVVGSSELIARVRRVAVNLGQYAAPFDCWLACRGLKTFALRMQRHCQNAQCVAEFLQAHPAVKRVYYPGLPNHPQYELASKLLRQGGGPMVSFDIDGGESAVEIFVRHLSAIPLSPSFGGVNTTFSYPLKTSHRSLSPQERDLCGIGPGLVRLSVGIEDWQDICADLGKALTPVGAR